MTGSSFDHDDDAMSESHQKMVSEQDVVTTEKGVASDSRQKNKIDRQKTCPFMVKMYCRINGHHRVEEFAPPRFPVEDEMIVYTWRDATLRELALLVRGVLGEDDLPGGKTGSDRDIKFSFKIVYPDPKQQGRFVTRNLGWAFEGGAVTARQLQLVDASDRTLDNLRFMPGDFIDVAIYTNVAMIPREPVVSGGANAGGSGTNGGRRVFIDRGSRR